MSDKLQEIKLLAQNAMATGKGHVDLTTYALTWLIEQLEQAEAENERLKADNQKLVKALENIQSQKYSFYLDGDEMSYKLQEIARQALTAVKQE